MQRIEVRKSRVLDLVATGLFGFMALGYVYTVVWEKHLAGVGFAILYGGIAALLWRFSPRKPLLIVDDEGLTINVPEVGLVPWDEVRGVEHEVRSRDSVGLLIYSRLREPAFVDFDQAGASPQVVLNVIQRELDRRFAAAPIVGSAGVPPVSPVAEAAPPATVAIPELMPLNPLRALLLVVGSVVVGVRLNSLLAYIFDDCPKFACATAGVLVAGYFLQGTLRVYLRGRAILTKDGVRQVALRAPMLFWGHSELSVEHGTLIVRSGSRTVRVRPDRYVQSADVIPFAEQEVARATRHVVGPATAKVS